MSRTQDILEGTQQCVYCPTLCLHACPVSTVEANDATSPWGKMSLARWVAEGHVSQSTENVAVFYKCTGCGACQDACRHGVDVSGTLQHAKSDAVERGVIVHEFSLFDVPVEDDDTPILPVGVSGCRLYAAGYTERFLSVARACARRWARRSEVIFASAEDVRCVREVYSMFGITVRPTVRLAADMVASEPMRHVDWDGRVAYHESCHIAQGAPEEKERLLQAAKTLVGEPLIELSQRSDFTTCCGASGAYSETSPRGARHAALRILQHALDNGAAVLLTGCDGCAVHMKKNAGDLPIKIATLSDI